MEEEVTVEIDGIEYSASYMVFDDMLVVYFPNGEQSEAKLGGMGPEGLARAHLRSFVKRCEQRKA